MAQKKKSNAGKQEQAKAPLTVEERTRRLKNLKSGDNFAYKHVGFGLVSYEGGGEKIWRKNGNLFTPTFDSEGMRWNGQTWEFDGGLGMKTLIVLSEDVPEGQLAE
ncbi:MAG: hypothetical protein IT405_00935 [Candidatus Yanofskybacteria bacterium]|nr:hypothetical protein [Candidatus Yanofskybacteria bacterium]